MNRAEYVLVLGLLLGIMSRVTTVKGFAVVYGFLSVVAVAYALVVETLTWLKNRQDAKQPPFVLQTQLFFQSEDERAEFGDRMKTLIQDMRREKDPQNGLSQEQLDTMAQEQKAPELSEEGKRYYEATEAAEAASQAPEQPEVPAQDEPTQEDSLRIAAELENAKKRKIQAKKGVAQKEVKRRYKVEHQSVEQIAQEMGYADVSTPYRYLKELGVKLRPAQKVQQ